MESHQELDVFLPKLRARLISKGMSEGDATFACTVIATGALPRTLYSLVEYQSAWTICNSMQEMLTTLDDGSEVAAWWTSVAQRIFDFEDAYKVTFGRKPMNPGPPEWTDGPIGTA